MEFLYKLTACRADMLTIGPTKSELAIIQEHSDYLDNLAKKGQLILYGRTQVNDETSFGLVVFVSKSEAEATQLMKNDPAVKTGVMKAELHPYKVEYINPDYK